MSEGWERGGSVVKGVTRGLKLIVFGFDRSVKNFRVASRISGVV